MSVTIRASLLVATCGAPPVYLTSEGRYLDRDIHHPVDFDGEVLVDLLDLQTGVGVADQLDKIDDPAGLSWVDRYTACYVGSHAILVLIAETMAKRIEEIGGAA